MEKILSNWNVLAIVDDPELVDSLNQMGCNMPIEDFEAKKYRPRAEELLSIMLSNKIDLLIFDIAYFNEKMNLLPILSMVEQNNIACIAVTNGSKLMESECRGRIGFYELNDSEQDLERYIDNYMSTFQAQQDAKNAGAMNDPDADPPENGSDATHNDGEPADFDDDIDADDEDDEDDVDDYDQDEGEDAAAREVADETIDSGEYDTDDGDEYADTDDSMHGGLPNRRNVVYDDDDNERDDAENTSFFSRFFHDGSLTHAGKLAIIALLLVVLSIILAFMLLTPGKDTCSTAEQPAAESSEPQEDDASAAEPAGDSEAGGNASFSDAAPSSDQPSSEERAPIDESYNTKAQADKAYAQIMDAYAAVDISSIALHDYGTTRAGIVGCAAALDENKNMLAVTAFRVENNGNEPIVFYDDFYTQAVQGGICCIIDEDYLKSDVAAGAETAIAAGQAVTVYQAYRLTGSNEVVEISIEGWDAACEPVTKSYKVSG